MSFRSKMNWTRGLISSVFVWLNQQQPSWYKWFIDHRPISLGRKERDWQLNSILFCLASTNSMTIPTTLPALVDTPRTLAASFGIQWSEKLQIYCSPFFITIWHVYNNKRQRRWKTETCQWDQIRFIGNWDERRCFIQRNPRSVSMTDWTGLDCTRMR